MSSTVDHDIRICFIGDSFVNGVGDESGLGWTGRLCLKALQSGYAVTCYNLGIRRNTSRDILSRWEAECDRRLPDFCDGRVVVSLGVNDTAIEDGQVRVTPDESFENVYEILRSVRSKYPVIMVGPPPTHDDEQNKRIEAISLSFRNAAKLAGVSYIEPFYLLVGDERYRAEILSNDGAHPRNYGYQRISEIISHSGHWWF